MDQCPTHDALLEKIEVLEKSNQTNRMLIDSSPDLLYRTDLEGRIVFISGSVQKLSGYTMEEALGMKMAEEVYVIPDERNNFLEKLQQEGRVSNFEARLRRKDGSVWWASTNAHFYKDQDGNLLGVEGVTRDISDLKVAEQALRVSEERFRQIFHISPDAVVLHRAENGMYIDVNKGFTDLLGYSREEVIGQTPTTINFWKKPQDRNSIAAKLLKERYVENQEISLVKKSGEIRVGLISARYQRINDEDVIVSITRDITERKRDEVALQESEERYRTLVEESPLGISLIGKKGRYKYLNPPFREMFGYTLEDIPTGKVWFQKAFPEEGYRRQVIQSWIEDQKQAEIGQARPRIYTVTCQDGSCKDIHFRPVTMKNRDQFVIYEDITERLKLEQQLQQAHRFEAVGTLAGGVAHDFNNLLMGIQGRASLMASEIGSAHPQQEHLDAIEEYVISATNLTKQLLGFARHGQYEVRPINLNDVVLASASMFGRTRKEIQIHTKTQPRPTVVEADKRQIEQVLLNIFVNAWQAMPDGGEIFLETRTVVLDEEYVLPYQVAPGTYAKISITDNGIGMDETTLKRIFDPFFTTKEKSRGTGLGLASAYGITKNHGGMITVYSEAGHGSTFNIYLPVSEKEVHRETIEKAGIVKGSGTVLLVDDEQMIIDVGKRMLELLGYHVLVAHDGIEAIEILSDRMDKIDLVVLDLIMPRMDGSKAFDGIRELNPAMPVILSSGYALNSQATEVMQKGCNGFIQKPFNIAALSQRVRGVLDESQAHNS